MAESDVNVLDCVRCEIYESKSIVTRASGRLARVRVGREAWRVGARHRSFLLYFTSSPLLRKNAVSFGSRPRKLRSITDASTLPPREMTSRR